MPLEASPLGANNDDAILKAAVLVYIRHHWIEQNPFAATELPAWDPPAMSRRVWPHRYRRELAASCSPVPPVVLITKKKSTVALFAAGLGFKLTQEWEKHSFGAFRGEREWGGRRQNAFWPPIHQLATGKGKFMFLLLVAGKSDGHFKREH